MFDLFVMALKNEWRSRYPTLFSVLGQFISEIGILFVYWFTSRAFTPNFNGGGDFFTFIFVGELALAVPIFLFLGFTRQMKMFFLENTWESILMTSQRASSQLMIHMAAVTSIEIGRVFLVLSLAFLFFDVNFQGPFYAVFLMQLLALPLFAGLGFMMASIVLVTGRGDRILATISSGLMILAGSYFPTQVLPDVLSGAASMLSPFNFILNSTRQILNGEIVLSTFVGPLGLFLSGGLICLTLGVFVIEFAIALSRRRQWPHLLRNI